MNEFELSPTFYKAFSLVVIWLIGQVAIKWIDWKFFQKENKWNGKERRQLVEIDEMLVKQFLDTYKRHVEYVRELSANLKTSTEAMKAFIYEFREHVEAEKESQRLIQQIHAVSKPA